MKDSRKTDVDEVTIERPSRGAVERPQRINVSELYAKIDEIRDDAKRVIGPEPTFLARLLDPNQRDVAAAIGAQRVAAIASRTELINALANQIVLYAQVHESDLRIRGANHVIATTQELKPALTFANERLLSGIFEAFSFFVDDIRRIPNLTPEMRETLAARAWDRAVKREEAEYRAFTSHISQFTALVDSIVREMEVSR